MEYGPSSFVTVVADPFMTYAADISVDDDDDVVDDNDDNASNAQSGYTLMEYDERMNGYDPGDMTVLDANATTTGRTDATRPTKRARRSSSKRKPKSQGQHAQRNSRRHTRYFLPRVTPNDWQQTCATSATHGEQSGPVGNGHDSAASDVDGIHRTTSDLKRLERLESIVLAEKDLHYSLIQEPNNAFPQFVGMGYVRATLGAAPFGQLQDVVAYMLKHKLVRKPENYDYYDLLKPTGGGREILLNELLKESDDTLIKAFLIMGRLRPAVENVKYSSTVTRRAKKKKQQQQDENKDVPADPESDTDTKVEANSENGASLVSSSSSSPTIDMTAAAVTSDLAGATEPRSRPNLDGTTLQNEDLPLTVPQIPKESNMTTTWYVDVPTDTSGILQANIGGPYNDKRVYVEHPVRSIMGRYDALPERVVDICGPEMNDWMRRTAHETKRDRQTFIQFEDYREKVADRKRAVCEVTPRDVQYAIDMVQKGQPLDEPVPWSPMDLNALRSIGWTDVELKRIGYLPAQEGTQQQQHEEERSSVQQNASKDVVVVS